jgi:3-oxoacyl-(acyl-carrier-protein) synthase
LKDHVHVAGLGVISAIGNSVVSTLDSLRTSSSGIAPLALIDSIHKGVLPVGEVKMPNSALAEVLSLPAGLPRTAMLGIHAAREAVSHSGIDLKKWRTGLISATTTGGMDKTEFFFDEYLTSPEKARLRDVVNHGCGRTTEIIAGELGIDTYISTINTACSSSANAIAFAARMITAGMLDVVVAGGTDALTKFTLNGFNSLMILDTQPCRPFDAHRKGLNLGEGAGFIVLVSGQVKKTEGLKLTSYINGYANTSDAYHQTASSPEGKGSFSAMQKALKMSGLHPEDIDYINLHGTGTINNDLSEGAAIAKLFGNPYPKLSSTKAFTGHTLGASGGIEAVFSLLAIDQQCVFPNLRFENVIPEIEIKPQVSFEKELPVCHVMSNSFGFGGNCSSIIFSKGQN